MRQLKKIRDMGLRTKLLVAYLGLSIVLFSCGGLGALYLVKRAVTFNIESDLRNGTRAIINLVETTTQGSIINYLRAVAESNLEIAQRIYKQHQQGRLTALEAREQIRDILLSQVIGKTGYIYCIDSQGVATVHPKQGVEKNNWASFEFVREQMQVKTGYIEYQWKNPGETESKPKALYMTYFEPFDWIISVSTYREEFTELLPMEEIRQSVKDLKYGNSGYVFVSDRRGNIIIHPELEGRNLFKLSVKDTQFFDQMLAEDFGEVRYLWQNPDENEAREKLAVYGIIPEFQWIVGSSGYIDEIYAPLQRARKITIIFIVAAVILSAILTLFVSSSITRRLSHLMEVIKKGDEGDLTVRTHFRSDDEIGQLGRIFNAFLERLQSYHNKLTAEIEGHRSTAESLQKERDFNALILSTVEALVIVLDREGRVVGINKTCQECSGYTLEEIAGQQLCSRLILKDEIKEAQATFDALIKEKRGNQNVNHLIAKNGQSRLIQWSNSIIPGMDGEVEFVVVAGLDITDQKATEQALRQSEAKFEAVFNQTFQYIGILNLDGSIRNINQTALDFAGAEEKDLIGLNFWEAPYWKHSEAIRSKVKSAIEIASQGEFRRMEVTQVDSNGEIRYVDFSIKPVQDRSGRIFLLIPEGRDINERKKAENILKQSEEKYRALVENAHDAIFIIQDDVLKYANQSTEVLSGYSAAELNNKPFTDHIHPDDRNKMIGRHQSRLEGRDLGDHQSFRILDRSGAIKWVDLNAIRIDWEDRPAIMCFARDITSQKQMEAQLLQTQKMDAIGTLAGGIAHDFNNSLQAISGYTQLLLMDGYGSAKEKGMLTTIQHTCHHAGELTRQLLTFSRKIESQLVPLDINAEVLAVMKLLQRTLPRMIEIKTNLAEDLRIVEADRVQFEQIMMNLSINAGHAMPNGGYLMIETKNVDLGDEFCRTNLGAKPGPYIMLSVSDNGHGMDVKTREHIFEPFFTTREIGSGTGLGLAMVYGIVKNHKGYITCSSDPSHGTTFKIYYPAVTRTIESLKLPENQLEMKGGSEFIMIVDDDQVVRQLGRQQLERFGYQVCEAKDGEAALTQYHQMASKPDLIILDLNMPGMGGLRCLREIKTMNPELPVLIASGYAKTGQDKAIIDEFAQGFVGKPYNLKEMLNLVRKTLNC
jgi:PAS domain S-box-containing protein